MSDNTTGAAAMSIARHPTHLIVAGAGFDGATVQASALPHLSRWLARSGSAQVTSLPDDALCLPHDQAHAHALGWTGDVQPWAALQTHTFGLPCAWLHLTHWQASMNQVQLLPPEALALTAAESEKLGNDLGDWLHADGITLTQTPGAAPGTYLLCAPWLATLPSLSWRRATGQALRRDELREAGVLPPELARLQSELEMWLYAHPLIEARLAERRLAPNGIWIDGAGQLDALPVNPAHVDTQLLDAALAGDARRHAEQWTRVDADVIAPWLARAEAAEPVTLTLAGTRGHATFAPAKAPSLWARAMQALRRPAPFELNTL